LAQVGDSVGWGWTISLVVLTAMIGSAMLRHQGLLVWARINERLVSGGMLGMEMVEGVLLLVGGALLVTPGFITDAIGFVFLTPVTRRGVSAWVIQRGVLEVVTREGFGHGGSWDYQQTIYTQKTTGAEDPLDSDVVRPSDPEKAGVLEGEVILKDDATR